jgi:hypothetical protein
MVGILTSTKKKILLLHKRFFFQLSMQLLMHFYVLGVILQDPSHKIDMEFC